MQLKLCPYKVKCSLKAIWLPDRTDVDQFHQKLIVQSVLDQDLIEAVHNGTGPHRPIHPLPTADAGLNQHDFSMLLQLSFRLNRMKPVWMTNQFSSRHSLR